MRYVAKANAEPAVLAARRKLSEAQGGTYAALEKRPVSEALMCDQGYLCGFCMRRVELFENDENGKARLRKTASNNWPWKIAHWEPQSTHGPRKLDWQNMVGACRGGDDPDGGHGPPRTCDTLQGSARLCVNPHDRATIKHVKGHSVRAERGAKFGESRYELYSDDPVIDGDLRLRLGLNTGYLPDNRKSAIAGFRGLLRERCPRHATLSATAKNALVRALYNEWKWEDQAKTRLRPFCRAVEILYRLA